MRAYAPDVLIEFRDDGLWWLHTITTRGELWLTEHAPVWSRYDALFALAPREAIELLDHLDEAGLNFCSLAEEQADRAYRDEGPDR